MQLKSGLTGCTYGVLVYAITQKVRDAKLWVLRLVLLSMFLLGTPRFYLVAVDFSPQLQDKMWEWSGNKLYPLSFLLHPGFRGRGRY